MKVSTAVKTLGEALKSDDELYNAYRANIAMAFYDEVAREKERTNYRYLNREQIHLIANQAAANFLNLLISNGQK